MWNFRQLRTVAREIFEETLRAVDPRAAIKTAIRLEPSSLTICDTTIPFPPDTKVFTVAIGKAATKMASAFETIFGEQFIAGVLAAPHPAGPAWQHFDGGHPLPNAASLDAAIAAIELLKAVDHENSLLVFLISGGGSAMLELPISDDITLEDLRSTNQILVNSGASITEINAVRRAFSAVKGGRLAAHAPKSQQVTLIVSDVPKGEEFNVASGPTLAPPADAPTANEIVARYNLRDKLPASVMSVIENPSAPASAEPTRHEYFVLLDNDTALEAAARAARDRGFVVEIARDISDGHIEAGCEKLMTRLAKLQQSAVKGEAICLISGGEFACPVRGDGIGGRNAESALRLAILAERNSERIGDFVALCAGTDGIDGNSPQAGAIVDSTTMPRAREMGLAAEDFLARSNSAVFFSMLKDAIETGQTGTNVRDLRILLTSA